MSHRRVVMHSPPHAKAPSRLRAAVCFASVGASHDTCTVVSARATMIDLFAGAGGLSLGLTDAGFELVGAVESDPDACAAFSSTHEDTPIEPQPIEEVSFREHRGNITLLAGGPPCQPFSSGGKRLADDDPRNGFPHFLRAVSEIQPDAVLIENVPGLASGDRELYFVWLLRALRARRYSVTWAVLNAADYGVPQKRNRLFVVGFVEADSSFRCPPTEVLLIFPIRPAVPCWI